MVIGSDIDIGLRSLFFCMHLLRLFFMRWTKDQITKFLWNCWRFISKRLTYKNNIAFQHEEKKSLVCRCPVFVEIWDDLMGWLHKNYWLNKSQKWSSPLIGSPTLKSVVKKALKKIKPTALKCLKICLNRNSIKSKSEQRPKKKNHADNNFTFKGNKPP